MNEGWIQIITILASNLLIMLTFFGISISLHNGLRDDIKEIQSEMKDFHAKLISLEERYRKLD